MRGKKVLVLALALILAGCGAAATEESASLLAGRQATSALISAPEVEMPRIALVMKTLTNPFFVEMEKGARQAEAELGIELLVKTGAQETSIEQQITIVESLIADQVDAIVIAPADSVELIPVLKKAQDAGITIVNIDNQLDPAASAKAGLTGVPFISVDNEQGAYLSADFVSDQITTPTKAIILEGIRTAKNAEDRKSGALRAFGENENVQVVATETAHWKIDEAHDVAASLFEQNPDIGVVFCANDMMAFGVVQYLEETNNPGVLVAAYDALEEAKQLLREGKLQATIDQQAALQGYTGVQAAVSLLKGETVPPVTLVEVMLVTRETVE